jgi:hypothetical protein
MSYIVILTSFQTIYSISYGGSEHSSPGPCCTKTLEPPLQYIENFQRPPFNARNYFGAPP